MATVRRTGNALNRKQVDAYTVGAPVSGSSIYTVTVNGKQYSYTAQSNTASDVATALAADFSAFTDIRELGDSPATASGAVVSFTSRLAGLPFANTYGVSGGGTFNGSTTTANYGAEVMDSAENWSAAIGVGDDLVFDVPNQNVRYRLTSLTTVLGTVTVSGTWDGEIGLPIINVNGYPEYRGCYAVLKTATVIVGIGDGTGPSRMYLQTDSGSAATIIVHKTGASRDGYPAVMLKHTAGGSNSFSVVRVVDGSVGIAVLPDEAATCTTLTIGDDNTSPVVTCGVGAAVTNMTITSGTANLVTMPSGTTIVDGGADVVVSNGGAATAIRLIDGTLDLGGKGSNFTVTDITIGSGGVLDLSNGQGTVTVTNGIKVYSGAEIIDPLNRLASSTVIIPQECEMRDITYRGVTNLTWTKS